uniref:RNase H type-1 domain-containing protein n=1 Tax=Brassica oleracea var. oleracea TaxID=109376 RepID=A0A0D3ABG6_BRAOL
MEALLKACRQMTALPPTGLTMPLHPWIMWVLWTSRNQFSFEDKSFSESEMILKAIKLAKEWQSAQLLPASSSVSSKDYQLSNKDQSPLQGDSCFQGSSFRRYVASALVAEAMALKSGLDMAATKGYKDVVCLSDSRCLVGLLTDKSSVIALKGLLHDICVLSYSLNSISFKFIPRASNIIADRIAKNALFVIANSPSG